MSDAPRIDWYPSDWLGGTRKLSAEERGIYIDLLMFFFEEEGALEADWTRLARAIGVSQKKLKSAVQTLVDQGKLEVENGFISNFRAKKELEKRLNFSKKATQSAKKRWAINRQKSNKNNETVHANASRKHMRSHPASICSGDASPPTTYQLDDDDPRTRARETDLSDIPFDQVDERAQFIDAVFSASGVKQEAEDDAAGIVGSWKKLDLTDDDVIEVIRAVRRRKNGGPPKRLAYFSEAMQNFARSKSEPKSKPVSEGKTDDRPQRRRTSGERAAAEQLARDLDFARDLDGE